MKALTGRKRTPIPLPVLVEEVNMSLRGWSGYFHYRNCTGVLGEVKWHVEERMRTHLRRRFKLHSRAQAQHHLPSSNLYGSYNLYKLPTTAAWRKAHAL
jgi:RNA-directed DNA polymerase